jgi:hypothetical protein
MWVAACGGGGGGGLTTVTAPAPCVDDASFHLRAVDDAPLNTVYLSNTVVVPDLCKPLALLFGGSPTAEYSLGGGAWTTNDITVRGGESLQARLTSAPAHATSWSATFRIGEEVCGRDPIFGGYHCRWEGVTSSFVVTTSPGSAAEAPDVTITYPLDGQDVNVELLTVTGTAVDPDGVAEIIVNGVQATSPDGFLTWEAEIPVTSGANQISVTSVDLLLNRRFGSAAVSVFNTALALADVSALHLSSASQSLYLVDQQVGGLMVIDLNTDGWQLLSADAGSGLPFIEPRRLLVDETGDRAWVVDDGYDTVLEIELSSGLRAVLRGRGESLADAKALAYDDALDRLLVLSQLRGPTTSSTFGSGRLISVDLVNGQRDLLSDNQTPAGEPEFWFSRAIVFDGAGDRVLLLDDNRIIDVDPISGARQLLYEHAFADLYGAVLDQSRARLIVSSEVGLFELDLVTGITTDIERLYEPFQFGYDERENRLFMLFSTRNIATYDLTTGEYLGDHY